MGHAASSPMACAQRGGVDNFHLRAERLAKGVLVLIVHNGVAEPGGNFHRCRQDAQELGKARSCERCAPPVLTAHRRVHWAVTFRIRLAHVEEIRVAQKRALSDNDPCGFPVSWGGSPRARGKPGTRRDGTVALCSPLDKT